MCHRHPITVENLTYNNFIIFKQYVSTTQTIEIIRKSGILFLDERCFKKKTYLKLLGEKTAYLIMII